MVAAVPRKMTLEEWAALPEDEAGELVDGEIVEEEAPDATHETVVDVLQALLRAHFRSHGGVVYGSGLEFAVRPRRGRLADIVCYRGGP